MKLQSTKIGIIGLGYVGLPLAIEFSKKVLGVNEELEISNAEAIDFVKREIRKIF